MTYDQLLNHPRRLEIISHFRRAMEHRAKQWDHERAIELIIDEEIDVDMGDFAVMVDKHGNTHGVSDEDIFQAIAEHPVVRPTTIWTTAP